jgi:hypothetical protein
MDDLTERQLAILAFERQWWKRHPAAVRHLFGCTRAQYQAELAELIALPAAVAYDPLLVKRLRRTAATTGAAAPSPRATVRSR